MSIKKFIITTGRATFDISANDFDNVSKKFDSSITDLEFINAIEGWTKTISASDFNTHCSHLVRESKFSKKGAEYYIFASIIKNYGARNNSSVSQTAASSHT